MENNKIVSFRDVKLADGFWKNRYELNKNVSIGAVRNKFEESARFDALRFNYLKNGRAIHYFYDSDAAKWIEGVAYLIEHDRASQKDNEAFIDELEHVSKDTDIIITVSDDPANAPESIKKHF